MSYRSDDPVQDAIKHIDYIDSMPQEIVTCVACCEPIELGEDVYYIKINHRKTVPCCKDCNANQSDWVKYFQK